MNFATLVSVMATLFAVACSQDSQPIKRTVKNPLTNGSPNSAPGADDSKNRYKTDLAGTVTMDELSPISVNDGQTFTITANARDSKSSNVYYIAQCPSEMGGVKKSSEGTFEYQVPANTATQSITCVVAAVNMANSRISKNVVVNIKNTQKSSASDTFGSQVGKKLTTIGTQAAEKGLNMILDNVFSGLEKSLSGSRSSQKTFPTSTSTSTTSTSTTGSGKLPSELINDYASSITADAFDTNWDNFDTSNASSTFGADAITDYSQFSTN